MLGGLPGLRLEAMGHNGADFTGKIGTIVSDLLQLCVSFIARKNAFQID